MKLVNELIPWSILAGTRRGNRSQFARHGKITHSHTLTHTHSMEDWFCVLFVLGKANRENATKKCAISRSKRPIKSRGGGILVHPNMQDRNRGFGGKLRHDRKRQMRENSGALQVTRKAIHHTNAPFSWVFGFVPGHCTFTAFFFQLLLDAILAFASDSTTKSFRKSFELDLSNPFFPSRC